MSKKLSDDEREKTMKMVAAIHQFAHDTECPAGTNVLKWFDHMWDQVVFEAKLLKEKQLD